MNLQEMNSPLPKGWLNINANSINTVTQLSNNNLGIYNTTNVSGSSSVTLTPQSVVAGILIISAGRTTNIGIPLSAAIDSYLGSNFAINGVVIKLIVINREPTNSLSLTSSEFPAQPIPKAQAIASTVTDFYFIRTSGIYTPLNS